MNIENISVFDDKYKKYERAWKYAIELVEKETHQAAEGFYHNLK